MRSRRTVIGAVVAGALTLYAASGIYGVEPTTKLDGRNLLAAK